MNYDTLDNTPTMDGGGQEGKALANRYKILRKLGEGGMGMVYLAEDMELGTRVAIKFVPPTLAGNARAIKNLKREAATAMQLSHPHIVRLHDMHTDGHQKFLVMECIEGRTLEEVLAEKENDRLSFEEMLPIAQQVGAALDFAHQRNVLHRDLKPSNIMMAASGEVKLLDFGIARELKDSYTRVTGHETSGTLPYMSPEQLRGQPPSPAMDIYSLAAVLYECLCGHAPFYTGDLRFQILEEQPQALDDPRTRGLMQALAKDPQQRPGSAAELVALLQGEAVAPAPDVGEKTYCGGAGKWIAVIVIALVVVGFAGFLLRFMNFTPLSSKGEPQQQKNGQEDSRDNGKFNEIQGPTKQTKVPPKNQDKGGGSTLVLGDDFPLNRVGEAEQNVAGMGDMEVVTGYHRSSPATISSQTNSQGMTLILIKAGTFQMGSPDTESGRKRDEGPVHRVTLTQDIWMGQTEVTVAQFRMFMESDGYQTDAQRLGFAYDRTQPGSEKVKGLTWKDPGIIQVVDREPVVCVSWNDAAAFCAWLSRKEGMNYRLPTEAEWEYACRAGTRSAYSWGDDPADGHAWCNGADLKVKPLFPDWKTFDWYDSVTYTGVVGKRSANAWGLNDMHGNVWEWVMDGYASDFYSQKQKSNPCGPSKASDRVLRGGSWTSGADQVRCAARHFAKLDAAFNDVGFRVVMEGK